MTPRLSRWAAAAVAPGEAATASPQPGIPQYEPPVCNAGIRRYLRPDLTVAPVVL